MLRVALPVGAQEEPRWPRERQGGWRLDHAGGDLTQNVAGRGTASSVSGRAPDRGGWCLQPQRVTSRRISDELMLVVAALLLRLPLLDEARQRR
jgi:hypothetical protein